MYAGDEVIDTEVHQLALAALQKLSLRRAAQEDLVAAGMIPWIVEYLRMHETLSEHAVEYSMAMLMNCCLCRSGRRACEELEVLSILDGMVQARALCAWPLCAWPLRVQTAEEGCAYTPRRVTQEAETEPHNILLSHLLPLPAGNKPGGSDVC